MPDVLARCTWYCSIATKPHQTLPTPKKNTHTEIQKNYGQHDRISLNLRIEQKVAFEFAIQ